MRVEFDYGRAPPPRVVVILDEDDVKRLKKGQTLKSNYIAGWGFILEVKSDE